MRVFTDWDCRLLPMMGDLIADPKDSARSLLLLKEKFGLSRFCMMPEFDCRCDSVAAFLARREKACEEILPLLPRDIQITQGGAALVYPGLSEEAGLRSLLLRGTNALPIRLPLLDSSNEIFRELNRLLYHVSYRILFLSFDAYLDFYAPEDIHRWSELPNVAFQFNYRAMESAKARSLLKTLIDRNAIVLFGTGINSYGKASYYEFDHYIRLAEQYFSPYLRDVLFFPKKLQ